jgi:hypothetical protein
MLLIPCTGDPFPGAVLGHPTLGSNFTRYLSNSRGAVHGLALMFWGIYSQVWWGALEVPLFIYGISPRRSEEEYVVNLREGETREGPPKKAA